jgi:hypothetical protein
MSCGRWSSRCCPVVLVVEAAPGMIIAAHWKALLGGSGPGRRGVTCLRSSVPGSQSGSGIAAGLKMAPTSECSPRSASTPRSATPRPRDCSRSTPRASGLINTPRVRASTSPRPAQGARSNYKDLPGEPVDHALGRSRGGWTTKIHALADERASPVTMLLSAGQAGDNPMLIPLLAAHHQHDHNRYRLLADKTSHALKVSSGGRRSGGRGGCGRRECGVFVVGLAGVEAVVQAADESVEQVALGGGVSVAGGSASVVVGSGAG